MTTLRSLFVAAGLVAGALAAAPPGPADAATLAAPVVAIASTTTGEGTFLAATDGGVFTAGDARFRGSMGGRRLAAPVVGIAADPDGDGYWLVASDGGIFSFGAPFLGSMGGRRLAQPIVGMAADPNGRGYALVARDGGIFTFGSFGFRGSMGNRPLNSPVVGMAADPDGDGYWLVAGDGGVFSFAATFGGSLGGRPLNAPITGMAAAPGGGYWLGAADGGVFALGGARFAGSRGGTPLPGDVLGIAARPTGVGYWLASSDGSTFPFGDATVRSGLGRPALRLEVVRGGLTIPWDVDVTPGGVLVYTERAGRLWTRAGGVDRVVGAPGDVFANSEGGMLGLAVDPDHARNRRIYVCQTTVAGSARDVRVYAWELSADGTAARRLEPALVGGIPAGNGRHNGCRPEVGPDGQLWVGTGDAATCGTSQDRTGLGGKVLRVDRFTGQPSPGNPFGRVYTYGHRNVQGLGFRPGSSQVFSVEHGPDRDDEINLLRGGGNAGWAPGCPYDESVPMTDTRRFPDAMVPVWTSGAPTIAPSGATFLSGPAWGSWQGALAVAALKGEHLRVFTLDGAGRVVDQEVALSGQGRLRSVTLAGDGTLYVTTAEGGGRDRILRLVPS